jgi:hypothetical protein
MLIVWPRISRQLETFQQNTYKTGACSANISELSCYMEIDKVNNQISRYCKLAYFLCKQSTDLSLSLNYSLRTTYNISNYTYEPRKPCLICRLNYF